MGKKFVKWDEFLEAKAGGLDTPPQGKGAAPYHAPHAKNDGSAKVRVAEKSDKKGLGDESTPALKDAKSNLPMGQKPKSGGVIKEERHSKDEKNTGKVKLRVLEKPSGTRLGDESSPGMNDPKKNLPMGQKPNYNGLTTEEFVKQTKTLSTAEFVRAMLGEAAEPMPGFGDDEEEGDDLPELPGDDDLEDVDFDDTGDDDDDDVEPDSDDDDDMADIPPMRCQYTGRSVMPAAHEVTRYMAHMLPHNERAVRMFVNELKSTPGALGSLMGEMVAHGELYDEMVNQIGLGKTKVARRFVKSMQDNHQKFMGEMGLLMKNPLGESVSQPMGERLPKPTMPQGQAPQSQPAPTGSAPTMIQDMPGDGTSTVNPVAGSGPDAAQQKLNKEFAYHHMIKEMKKYDNMVQAMNEILGG